MILSLGYKHELVEEWLHSFDTPLQVSVVVEDEPLGTGGGIKYALQQAMGDDVLVVNGDTLFALNVRSLLDIHHKNGCVATLGLKPMQNFDRYGSVVFEGEKITAFSEKAFCKQGLINGGVFCLKRDALERMPQKFSFEQDFLIPETQKRNVGGYVEDAYFIDIGIPSDYEKAQWEISPLQ